MSMNRFMNRRRFALGAGLLLGGASTQLGRNALAQQFERRDPRPQYKVVHSEPVNPRIIQRWDTKNGLLQPQGGTLDETNPFSASPSYRIQFNEPGSVLLARWDRDAPLPLNVFHLHLICKAERLIGPLALDIKLSFTGNGAYSSTQQKLVTHDRSQFDWENFVYEIGPFNTNGPELATMEVNLRMLGTGRVWIGALEFLNLGLPERHPKLTDIRNNLMLQDSL